MLVLTRRANQSIQIGPDIVITVRMIQGNNVRIAIDAPKEIRIRRAEIPPEEDSTFERRDARDLIQEKPRRAQPSVRRTHRRLPSFT